MTCRDQAIVIDLTGYHDIHRTVRIGKGKGKVRSGQVR